MNEGVARAPLGNPETGPHDNSATAYSPALG